MAKSSFYQGNIPREEAVEALSDYVSLFRMPIFIGSTMAADEQIVRFVMTEDITFEFGGLNESRAEALTPATSTAVISIQKNDVQFASITFESGQSTGSISGLASFVAGDILSLVGPSVPDATLADISITLASTRAI
jgi:hypothetical protein